MSLREVLDREVFEREGKIRFYSGFNLDGFFKGYKDYTFNKASMSPQYRVWFYLGRDLVSNSRGEVHETGTDRDYLKYFVMNYLLRVGSTIRKAAGSSLSRMKEDYEPCVFSGLISLDDVIDAGSSSWNASRGPEVPVDTLYKVKGSFDFNRGTPSVRGFNEISLV